MATLEKSLRKVVTQDNALIEAAYGLTLNEKRLVLIGIGSVNPTVMPNKNEPLGFTVTVQDWLEAYPDSEAAYRDMQRAAKDLQSRSVTFRPKTGIRDSVNWCDSVRYYEGEARISIKFGWTMSHFLQGMMEQFTSFDLLSIQRLTSIHSIRLFELISQYKSTGYRRETLEDLKFSLNVSGSYTLWNDFNRQVLKKAVKEINAKSDYLIKYEPVKHGRKVVAVEFSFRDNKQKDLFK
jgi:plasmid replication initiation protein